MLNRARTTKHPWLMASDADMSLDDFEKSLWFRKDQMHVIREEGEEDEGSEERRIRDQIVINEGVKDKVKRTGGQSPTRS